MTDTTDIGAAKAREVAAAATSAEAEKIARLRAMRLAKEEMERKGV